MPVKKSKRRKEVTDEKKIVTSRLLTISLKVDDYIYQKVPIPLKEAKSYAKEISQLKTKCRDERSRQVAEKLTSIVKSILDEYNFIDEKKTNASLPSNKANVTEHIEYSNTSDHNLNVENVHILATKENDTPILKTQKSTEAPIEKLNDFIKHPDGNQNDIASKTTTDNNSENLRSNLNESLNQKSNIVDSTETAKEITNTNVSECYKNTNDLPNESNNEENKEVSVNSNNNTTEDNVPENKRSQITTQKTSTSKKVLHSNSNKHKANLSKKKKEDVNRQKNATTKRKKKQTIDLTWVENITFVREVHTDEHISSDFQESFWSDLTMPSCCNLDFNTD